MKTIGITISLVVWMILSLFAAITVIPGLFLFTREDSTCEKWQGEVGESVWLKIGKKLTEKLINL